MASAAPLLRPGRKCPGPARTTPVAYAQALYPTLFQEDECPPMPMPVPQGGLCPSLSESSCPIPATDWRMLSQNSPDAHFLGGNLHGVGVAAGAPLHSSYPLMRSSSDQVQLAQNATAAAAAAAGPWAASSSNAQRRNSMSSAMLSASEVHMQHHYQQQLLHHEERSRAAAAAPAHAHAPAAIPSNLKVPVAARSGSFAISPPAAPASLVPGAAASLGPAQPGSGPRTSTRSASASFAIGGQALHSEGEAADVLQAPGLREFYSETSVEESDPGCVNWNEVEELCKKMDMAGLKLENIDILCLPQEDSAPNEHPESIGASLSAMPASPEGSSASTLLSLKFSDLNSRHCPADAKTKELFQDIVHR